MIVTFGQTIVRVKKLEEINILWTDTEMELQGGGMVETRAHLCIRQTPTGKRTVGTTKGTTDHNKPPIAGNGATAERSQR